MKRFRAGIVRIGKLAVVAWVILGAAASPSGAARADLERAGLSEFSRLGIVNGSLEAVAAEAYEGRWFARASYDGSGRNGYARGAFDVSWIEGMEVRYGAAFRLPVGFRSAMQGQVALMRWDNWPARGSVADHGGIVINRSDKRARLIRETLGGDGSQDVLVGPFELPEGRWFLLEVRQRLGSQQYALSQVYLDGELIGTARVANMYRGRAIERIRYGLVAVSAGRQTQPLSLGFDIAFFHAAPPAARLVRGRAVPAPGTPRAVRRLIRAANRQLGRPRFASSARRIGDVLRTAGLLSGGRTTPRFKRWGRPGPGRHVTVYFLGRQAFMVVDDLRLEARQRRDGRRVLRWAPRARSVRRYHARHPAGL